MAIASAAQPVLSTTPVEFRFDNRKVVKAQIRFYSDAAGLVKIAAGTGTRSVVVTTSDLVICPDDDYTETLDSGYAGGATAVTDGDWYEFAFADGAIRASFACSGGVDPAGAVTYRVILSIGKLTPAQ